MHREFLRQRLLHPVQLTLLVLVLFLLPAHAQKTSAPDPHSVPTIDGGIGNCSYDFTITDDANKPIYNADIKVRVNYGFMYARRLDLEVGTNIDGKARFTGLPERVKRGLFFEASESGRTGNAFVDPSTTCKSQFTVVLRKPLN